MNDRDDHVIPYEEAVRRHRALELQKKSREAAHEVRISDAMTHLLDDRAATDEDGASPAAIRRIVEREFAEDEGSPGGGSEQPPGDRSEGGD